MITRSPPARRVLRRRDRTSSKVFQTPSPSRRIAPASPQALEHRAVVDSSRTTATPRRPRACSSGRTTSLVSQDLRSQSLPVDRRASMARKGLARSVPRCCCRASGSATMSNCPTSLTAPQNQDRADTKERVRIQLLGSTGAHVPGGHRAATPHPQPARQSFSSRRSRLTGRDPERKEDQRRDQQEGLPAM